MPDSTFVEPLSYLLMLMRQIHYSVYLKFYRTFEHVSSSLDATMNRMFQRLEPLTNSKHVVGNQIELNQKMNAVNTMPFFCSVANESKVDDRREKMASLPTLNDPSLGPKKKTQQKQNGKAGVIPNNAHVPSFCTSEKNVLNTHRERSPSRHSSSVGVNKKTTVHRGTLPVSRAVTLRIPQSQHFKEQSTDSSKQQLPLSINFASHFSNIQNQFQSILVDFGMMDWNRR